MQAERFCGEGGSWTPEETRTARRLWFRKTTSTHGPGPAGILSQPAGTQVSSLPPGPILPGWGVQGCQGCPFGGSAPRGSSPCVGSTSPQEALPQGDRWLRAPGSIRTCCRARPQGAASKHAGQLATTCSTTLHARYLRKGSLSLGTGDVHEGTARSDSWHAACAGRASILSDCTCPTHLGAPEAAGG